MPSPVRGSYPAAGPDEDGERCRRLSRRSEIPAGRGLLMAADPGPARPAAVPVSPLLPDDPPKIGGYWLDARLRASPAGTAFTAHS